MSPIKIIQDRARGLDLDEFLSRSLFAHLATASEFGPRESPVWFLWEGGVIWIIRNGKTDSFPARIAREERCAIGIVDFDPSNGLVQHVGFRGRATVHSFDKDRARRLLVRYLGEDEAEWDSRFRETLTNPHNVLIRFEPETAVVRDLSYTTRNR